MNSPALMTQARQRGGKNCHAPTAQPNPPEMVEKLVAENAGLVHHIAKQFRSSTISHEDLIGEGMIGLVEGAQRYNPAFEAKPCSYIGFWIRARIFLAMQKDAGARTSKERLVFFRMTRAMRELERQGITPTPESIGAQLGVSPEWVRGVHSRLVMYEVRLDARPDPGRRAAYPESKDAALSVAETAEDAYSEAETSRFEGEAIQHALKRLPEREATIIRMRYLSGRERVTLQDVATHFGLSRERMRQLEARALRRLKFALERLGVAKDAR